jgi:sigma-B regulation protein RsbU (phosphoserine phosphatase)
MKQKFIALINFGIKPETPANIAEQIRLLNAISLIGIPVCLPYILLFGITGNYVLSLTFFIGAIIFTIPLFLNKWVSVSIGRIFISLMASIFFGTVSVLSGKDAGFYLGFLVVSVPPLLLFPSLRTGLIFVGFSVLCLLASIYGNMIYTPSCVIPFPLSMVIYLINLFTVLLATLGVVFIFKSELSESRVILEEKNKEITDSIRYAKRIQQLLLPPDRYIEKNMDRLKNKKED